ncbi:ligand-binding sensor domain-containing diguanylate cyclase [Pseudomarimonas salicorniae]|uniref:diguanylate cyclase n=1 Tax=Pseudomarimonas salicorniae TaxID=2933270 RepID=A0ABT0GHJ2_9GAMM|nr:ligand-binding sensor domain-containing diguanylate cyclase [Lysobacter sp. CAU 1642]MCK7594011.1 diguanylate cyclase [Lysobacter sp. CAU 1642]
MAALWLAGVAAALDSDKRFHDYVRDVWSIEQGLPQISARAIAQDGEGYLWIGTQAGLARFDGHRFTVYTPEAEPALPGGWVNDLLSGPDGVLWIATYKGLARRQDGRFEPIPLADDVEAQPDIADLAAEGETVLAASGNAVYAVVDARLQLRLQLSGPARSLLVEDDALWIGSLGGVYRHAAGQTEFLKLPTEAATAVAARLVRAQGRLWAGTTAGLFWLDGDLWQPYVEAPHLVAATIEALHEDRDGNLWVAELAHLTRLRDGRPVERVVDGEAGLAVRRIFEDREHNLWLGSQWNGLSRLRDGWTRRYGRREGLESPLLWSLAADGQGGLWVGSDNGLQRLVDGRFESVVPGSALPHPNAYTLLPEDGRLWIGTRAGLALWQDGQLGEPTRFVALRGAQVNGLLRDAEGLLWIATNQGLFRDDGQVLQRFDEDDGLLDARVRHLLLTRDGRLLVGSQSGPHEFRGERFVPIGLEAGLPPGLDITVQHELPDGRLVLGSLNEALHYFDGQRWHSFGAPQGVPQSAPFFVADHAGMLWVAGIRGIYRVPLADLAGFAAGQRKRVRGQMLLNERGDRRGGQKGFCCNGAGLAKGLFREGVLWAPTRDGVVALDTADVRFDREPPPAIVERWRVGGEWRAVDAMAGPLPEGQRDLSIEFTAISFLDPRSVAFRYRLIGYHEDWREPEAAELRIAAYTNLAAGDYRFEVQASTVEGRWSKPAAIEFSVPPRFTETGLFRALLGLLLALGGLGLLLLQRRRYKQRAAELERLVQARTADLAEANRQLQEASLTDPLTGLRNRRYLSQQIPKDLAFYGRELQRNPGLGQVIVFALLDIDFFKRVNDEHGHAAGDRVLEQFAGLLQNQVRTGDYVARWGGEEFMVVFRPTPAEFVPLLGERLCRGCAEREFDFGNGRSGQVTCSVGLVEYPLFTDAKTSLDWEQLVELADRALYRVKRSGRNGWGAYRPNDEASMSTIIEALRFDESAFENSDALRFVGTYGEDPLA